MYELIDGYCDIDYIGIVEQAENNNHVLTEVNEEYKDSVNDVCEGYSFEMLVALAGGCLTSEVEKRVRKSDCVVSVNVVYNNEPGYPRITVKTRQGVTLSYMVERNRKREVK